MNAVNLGYYNTSSTRTHVRFQFSTHAAAGANVAPNSAFEAADIRIYKAAGGAAFSATQRSSANGITMTSPFDSLTGVHDVVIDLTDNTDASFYAAGCLYAVMLCPDETIDSQTITGVVLAYFEIGRPEVDIREVGGSPSQVGTAQTGDSYPIVSSGTYGNSALKTLIDTLATYVDTEVAAIKAKTDNLPSDPADASDISGSFGTVNSTLTTIAGYLDTEIAAIKAKTDNLPSDPADASDIAASFSSIASTLTTIAGYLDTEIASIKAKTDNLPAAPASTEDITSATSPLATEVNLAAAKTVVDAIKVVTDALTAASAAKLALSGGQIITGTVDSTVTPTTTAFEADDITEATADHYNGRVIIFTSGALTGQATSISDYALASGKGRFTVVALTEAPANNDTFIIV